MGYVINDRSGVVHDAECKALASMRTPSLSPWDPTKAHLAVGAVPCPACLPALPQVPPESLREAMMAAGLVRGGQAAAMLGLEAVEFDWRGTTVYGYRISEIERAASRLMSGRLAAEEGDEDG